MSRVVVTGIGLVTPLGGELARFQARLIAGESAAGPIVAFDPARLPTRVAAEVREADLLYGVKDRKIAFGEAAAARAVADAQLFGDPIATAHCGASAGLSLGLGLELFSLPDMIAYRAGRRAPANSEDRLYFLQTPSDLCLHAISRTHRLTAPPQAHISACAAATDAIGNAFRLVRSGRRRYMLAGGTDSMINPMGVAGFCKIGAMTTRNYTPAEASRPFDRRRDGFLLGEGAGVLVLEERTAAEHRGARIYAEVLGYGNSFDAHAISEPHPEGAGAVLAMQRALADAQVEPDMISYINAHGTATPKNDPAETKAIHAVFGERAGRIPISSTKSMLGHLISAAGAVETAAAILCARQGMVHPTINLTDPDPACDLDYVPLHARPCEVRIILKNSFGFGGQNASLVIQMEDSHGRTA